ncbi:DUF2842 domain-containing protein [Paracoccus aminophilus]|uniref:DUF2842 domain-containing protein n=1 Tax=Paracoccus aminophilus JCM 7686 TaxID=1367847 RepID=S5XQF5_PARAH|nr:DUF2842 domain-containing protein [Paracoccus aminophilus]AGT09599.1 hypothetical protein JCM7686_2531 [Paracoccus aminophilus JCM 7686]
MDLKIRKRWSLVVLLIGLPLYIVVAVTLMNWLDRTFGRQPIVIEVLIYVALGVIWAFPFKRIFTGIGKEE